MSDPERPTDGWLVGFQGTCLVGTRPVVVLYQKGSVYVLRQNRKGCGFGTGELDGFFANESIVSLGKGLEVEEESLKSG